jgi:hypothetical protein
MILVCEPSPTIENGEITLQEEGNHSFGAIARIDCNTGYTASITAIQCRENGTWDTTICSIISLCLYKYKVNKSTKHFEVRNKENTHNP